jgi:basic amino acid/polyamine antiporter, APA family
VRCISEKPELKKSLGLWSIIALTITAMVGTGMFLGTAIGAKYSGNGVLIAWAILIIISTYVAMCFGELISLYPRAGGVYEFSKQAYGGFPSFLMGWLTWMMSTLGVSILIIAALQYLLPASTSSVVKLSAAIAIVLFFNFIAFLGVEISAAVLMIFAVEIVVLFLSLIIPGFSLVKLENFTTLVSGEWFLVFVSLFFMIESLMGWEAASFLAEETKDAARTIPKALIITTLIAGLLGFLLSFVMLGVIPASEISGISAPATELSVRVNGTGSAGIISIGIVLALLGSVIGVIISTPRLLLAMARDKMFISQLASIHPRRKTPHNAIMFQTIVSIILLLVTFGNYSFMLALFTPLSLVTYSAVILAVPVLRLKFKDAKREFKTPLGLVGPVIVAFVYAAVVALWAFNTPNAAQILSIAVSLILFGLPIYLLMIFYYNPDAVNRFMSGFSRINLWLEAVLLPKNIRKEMIAWVQDLYEKKVLEYGAGVGTLTLMLSRQVGPKGKVYATDLSHRNIKLIEKRLIKKDIGNVVLIHDEHHANRISPQVKFADAIVSVGVLSYIQDPEKVIGEMARILPDTGKICLVEYVNFFKVLPDKEWLSRHEELKRIFRSAGISIKVRKKAGLFWNFIFIEGVKSHLDVPIM